GILEFDSSKPDGTPRKLMDVSRLKSLGWEYSIALESGLKSTYAWYLNNLDWCRRVQDGSYQRERLGVNA
ncbi:MAG: hypothetical protein RR558_11740, partial [Coprobacillus sp.]